MSKHEKPRRPRTTHGWSDGPTSWRHGLISIAVIFAAVFVLFQEIVLKDMAFSSQTDTIASISYEHAGRTLQDKEGGDVLWMPYFFSGMPTFGNMAFLPHDVNYLQSIVQRILNLAFLNGKWTWYLVYFFLGGVFMYWLARHYEFRRPIALFAAFTFILGPYMVGLPGEGHGSKMISLMYIPLLLLCTSLLVERRSALWFGALAAVTGTLLLNRHQQIAYYALLVVGLSLLVWVWSARHQGVAPILRSLGLVIGALLVGFVISAYVNLSVYDYAQYSMRGGGTKGSTGGLAWDYATNWSWHPAELITLVLPGFFGLQVSTYWGSIEPWTNSSVYVGLLPIFFSVLALVYRRNTMTIFLAALTAVVVLISFGRNFAPFYEILFATLPFFNKFRAPSMILHLLPLLLALLGAYGFAFLLGVQEQMKEADRLRLGRVLLYVTGGLVVLFFLALVLKSWLFETLSTTLFLRENEGNIFRQQYGQQASRAMAQIKQLRFDIFYKDLLRSTALGALAVGGAWMLVRGKMKPALFASAAILFVMVDLWSVSGKYVSPVPDKNIDSELRPTSTITYLQQQEGLFRVFPVGQLFMDNLYAYHGLQSIGGYSPAKLKIYQTMLDSCLERNSGQGLPWNLNVLNMLNAGYLVVPGMLPETPHFQQAFVDESARLVVYRNANALPRAWYVGQTVIAQNDGEVFRAMRSPSFDPASVAVLYAPPGGDIAPQDSGRLPAVTEYSSRRIVLKTETASPTLLVLSEVYYPAGWKAFIDGRETEILRANYVLRSVRIPAGTHEVVFAFQPELYGTGWTLTHAGWATAGIAGLLGLWSIPAVRRRFSRAGAGTEGGGREQGRA